MVFDMSKKQIFDELINILAVSLRHKIGSIVNEDEIYAERYAKDAEILFKQAEKVKEQCNWNYNDKLEVKENLKKKLTDELKKRDFISEEKYDYIESEIETALRSLKLDI